MNSWDLGKTVSCSAYLLVMRCWGFRILKCVLVYSWDLGDPRLWDLGDSGSEIYTCDGTSGTQDPEMYT